MNLSKSYKKIITLLGVTGMSLQPINAAIVVSNWNIAGDVLTFDLSGTIDAGVTIGGTANSILYIGVPGDGDWVGGNGTTRNISNNSGAGIRDIRTNSGGYFTSGGANFAQVQTADTAAWQIGDEVSASIQFSGGSLTSGNIVTSQIIVAAGFTTSTDRPEAAHQVGAAVVPEPEQMIWLSCIGLASFGLYRYRKQGLALD